MTLLFTLFVVFPTHISADWGYVAVDSTANADMNTVQFNNDHNANDHAHHVRVNNMPGGLGQPKPVDPEIQTLVNTLHTGILHTLASSGTAPAHFVELLKSNSVTITPLAYRTQVVAGLNYFVKVKLALGGAEAETQYAIVRIYRPLPNQGSPQVINVRVVEENSPVEYI